MSLFDIIMIFAVGWILGSNFTVFKFRREVEKLTKDIDFVSKNDTATPKVVVAETEVHEDVLYLYDKGNDVFLCQGSSLEDLAEKLIDWHKINYACVKHLDSVYWFIDGKVKNNRHES